MSTATPESPGSPADPIDELERDEAYFDDASLRRRSFDSRLLEEPLTLLPSRPPLSIKSAP